MRDILYALVELVAKVHNKIMHLNDAFEYSFTDKEMHFLVIGILGMCLLFVVYPLFKWLAENKHVMIISWIYVFTMVVVVTFAIEIGQKVTNTGNMEFADIMFGVIGFIGMFLAFSIIRGIYHLIMKFIDSRFERKKETMEIEELYEEQSGIEDEEDTEHL